MKNKPIYSVIAHRDGEDLGHAYVYSFTRVLALAQLEAKYNDISRGGKYETKISKLVVENPDELNELYVLTYDDNKKGQNTHIRIFISLEKASEEFIKINSLTSFRNVELDTIKIEDFVRPAMIQDYHDYIDSYNNESKAVLRDAWEKKIRTDMDRNMLLDLAKTTDYVESLEYLVKMNDMFIDTEIAKRDIINKKIINTIMERKWRIPKTLLIFNSQTDEETFIKLYEEDTESFDVCKKMAKSEFTPKSVLDKIADYHNDRVKSLISINPNTATETLWRMYQTIKDDKIRQNIIHHHNFVRATQILETLKGLG